MQDRFRGENVKTPTLIKQLLLATILLLPLPSMSAEESVQMTSYYIPGLVNSETDGVLVDMLGKISEYSGINFKLRLMPTKRVQQSFAQGNVLAYYPELEENRHYPSCRTSNMLQKQIIVFTRAGDDKIDNIAGLHGKKVGAVSGYSYGTEIIKNAKINIQYVKDDDINLKKLLSGRVDAIVGDVHSTVNAINANKANDKVFFDANNPINILDVFFLFREGEKEKEICDAVTVALDKLKEEGQLFEWFGYK